MGDFDNLAREMTRRERIHAEVRERGISSAAHKEWQKYADMVNISVHSADEREAFVTGFDLGCDSASAKSHPPTDYARIAVLQTEREHIRRELARLGDNARTGRTPLIERYDAIDNEIRKALG